MKPLIILAFGILCLAVQGLIEKIKSNRHKQKPKTDPPGEPPHLLDEYHECLDYIRKELKEIYPYCENTRTIEQSNRMFFATLRRAKLKAFSKINSINKPHIIYRINKYYSFY